MEPITFAERLYARIAYEIDQRIRIGRGKRVPITDPDLRQAWYLATIYYFRSLEAAAKAQRFTDKQLKALLDDEYDKVREYNKSRLISEYEQNLYKELSIQTKIKSKPAESHLVPRQELAKTQDALKQLETLLKNIGVDPDELRQRILG